MDYQKFKKAVVESLEEYYGEDAKVEIVENLKLNGKKVEQVIVRFPEDKNKAVPCHPLKDLHQKYKEGLLSLDECVEKIVDYKENDVRIQDCKDKLIDWNYVKDRVFPVLINTAANKDLLDKFISADWLDLSIIFQVREQQAAGGFWSAYVSKKLFSLYGISTDQMMEQALYNLRQEGYCLSSIYGMTPDHNEESFKEDFFPFSPCEQIGEEGLFVLSNQSDFYGASGILDKEILRKICGEKNAYIIPSSVHETLFLSESAEIPVQALNKMINEINRSSVREEEVLSDHAYFYDAETQDIRVVS